MKRNIILRVLLCFLIIGNSFLFGKCEAAPAAQNFFDAGHGGTGEGIVNGFLDPVMHVQSLIMMIGVVSAVIVVLIYGIQWAMATSAKRQELKSGMWPLVIGIALLALGPKLANSIYEAFNVDNGTAASNVKTIGGTIVGVVQTLGYIVAVAMVLIIGVQWLTAVPSKRQELKSRMINLSIGAILIVSGTTVLGWIYNMFAG